MGQMHVPQFEQVVEPAGDAAQGVVSEVQLLQVQEGEELVRELEDSVVVRNQFQEAVRLRQLWREYFECVVANVEHSQRVSSQNPFGRQPRF